MEAARTVNRIDVAIKAIAKNHVTFPSGVVGARPDIFPPPLSSPPPSERWRSTTPISESARIRWMMRTTFSMKARPVQFRWVIYRVQVPLATPVAGFVAMQHVPRDG